MSPVLEGEVLDHDVLDRDVKVLGSVERDAVAAGLASVVRDAVAGLSAADERRWWRLVGTETFDAWLIDWPSGTSVPRHDHDGAAASICVVRGRLVETRYAASSRVGTSVLVPGRAHRVTSASSHEILNRDGEPATSVHVYSPPLRSMAFYDADGVETRRDAVDAAPALWGFELS